MYFFIQKINLLVFFKTCKNAIYNKYMEENHINHNLEKRVGNFSKEEVNKMLEIIKKKEEQFNIDIKNDKEKMENGINTVKVGFFLGSYISTTFLTIYQNMKKILF